MTTSSLAGPLSLGHIIEAIHRRSLSETTLEKLQELESDVRKQFDELHKDLHHLKEDTQHLQLLRNKLLFIEQFYLNKTSFETEIDAKLARIEDSIDGMKRNVEVLMNEVRTMKKKLNVLCEKKSSSKFSSARWKVWQIFLKPRNQTLGA